MPLTYSLNFSPLYNCATTRLAKTRLTMAFFVTACALSNLLSWIRACLVAGARELIDQSLTPIYLPTPHQSLTHSPIHHAAILYLGARCICARALRATVCNTSYI